MTDRDPRLQAIRARCQRVLTEAPWMVQEAVSYIQVRERNGRGVVCDISNHQSGQRGQLVAEFIAAASEDMPYLLDCLTQQAQLQQVEVTQPNGQPLPAPCAISGCHYAQLQEERDSLQEQFQALLKLWESSDKLAEKITERER